jgi:tripartite-type tricarboxylate transporter receptor subunit TctC
MNQRRTLIRAAAFAPFAAMAPRANAQAPAFPARTITLVCPLAPGSSIDVIARVYATRASALLGVPVIVDNKPGAGGAIAAGLVMRAPADGNTLLIASNTYIVAPHVYRKSEYDPLVTFTPVTGLFTTGIVLSARPDFPARSLGEFIALAKANPGKYTYSTWGVGTSAHLQMELLRMRTGIDVLHVPYKSGPEASQATMSGLTDLGFDTVFGVAPRLKAGQLRALTVFAPRRATVLPEVPTNVEQGIPDIEQLGFCGRRLREAPAGLWRGTLPRHAGGVPEVPARGGGQGARGHLDAENRARLNSGERRPGRDFRWPGLIDTCKLPPGKAQHPVRDFLRATFLTRTRTQWAEWFKGRDIPFAPVNTLPEVLDDPHFRERGMVLTDNRGWDHIGNPIRFADEPGRLQLAPPAAGEHSNTLLRELNYSASEMDRLLSEGVVKEAAPEEILRHRGPA